MVAEVEVAIAADRGISEGDERNCPYDALKATFIKHGFRSGA